MEIENISCPVCNKNIPIVNADTHVDKCLFLNSQPEKSTYEKSATKRGSDNSGSPAKKSKSGLGLSSQNTSDFQKSSGPEKLENKKANVIDTKPLAEKVRPAEIADYFGQEHIIGPGKILRVLLEKQEIPSMILWGPPGCGKTTLAHIISKTCNEHTRFIRLSATMSGVNEVKEIVKVARNEQKFKKKTILFIDEIHRFNKLQQDIFLPHVENGILTLIGATTENPSFSLNSALLSRCRVIVLEKLTSRDLEKILSRAVEKYDFVQVIDSSKPISFSTSNIPKIIIEKSDIQWLADICDGDARIALNTLQIAIQSMSRDKFETKFLQLDVFKESLKKSHMLYDKKGEEHYNMISAMQKSIRASDDNAALYWVTRMLLGGEDPLYIARRLVRTASEDVGLADPNALPLAVSAMQGCQLIGMPECDVLLGECAIYLARAPKSKEVEHAMDRCKDVINNWKGPQPGVPLHLRNAPTKLMKNLGYGKGYNTREKHESNLTYLPEGLEDTSFF